MAYEPCMLAALMRRRELIATVSGREVSLAVEREASGRYLVSTDGGPPREVDAVEIGPGTWSLLCDGLSIVVEVDRRGPRAAGAGWADGQLEATEVLVRGQEAGFAIGDARRYRLAEAMGVGSRAAGRGEVVRAPIAGKVVKLLCAAGEEVGSGQGVCVLEAMKMENQIKADRGGAVAAIHVAPGDSVDTDEPLVTLR